MLVTWPELRTTNMLYSFVPKVQGFGILTLNYFTPGSTVDEWVWKNAANETKMKNVKLKRASRRFISICIVICMERQELLGNSASNRGGSEAQECVRVLKNSREKESITQTIRKPGWYGYHN